jgi:hypothetical protein
MPKFLLRIIRDHALFMLFNSRMGDYLAERKVFHLIIRILYDSLRMSSKGDDKSVFRLN